MSLLKKLKIITTNTPIKQCSMCLWYQGGSNNKINNIEISVNLVWYSSNYNVDNGKFPEVKHWTIMNKQMFLLFWYLKKVNITSEKRLHWNRQRIDRGEERINDSNHKCTSDPNKAQFRISFIFWMIDCNHNFYSVWVYEQIQIPKKTEMVILRMYNKYNLEINNDFLMWC